MYSKPRLAIKYLRYLFSASNGKGHGVHSPFVYGFIRNVLKDRPEPDWFPKIEALRTKWLRSPDFISVTDLGGKGDGSSIRRSVSGLAARSLSSRKFGRFLFRLARYYSSQHLLELGTSLGISGSYLLAGAGDKAKLVSIEGSGEIAALARKTFDELNFKNVQVVTGDFELALPATLKKDFQPDLVFIDGNHRKFPLLAYFNLLLQQRPLPVVIVLHDIHWSNEMEEGWQTICSLPQVRLTVDLFSAGLVFFDDKFLIKQHFTIRF